MNDKNKQRLLSLRFIPFVLTNGMNLFPVLILAQLFLKYREVDKYVLPLILYFSFKTTILFLVRLKPITVNGLLQFSIVIGVIGSFLGSFYESHLYFGLLAGALLGICSGLLYPSFLTVQFHEKTYNGFSTGTKDQLHSIAFAFVFSIVLFVLMRYSIAATFIFLGVSLIVLLLIIRAYPSYELENDIAEPKYPLFETLFLFTTGFFVIFIIKADKKLGIADSLPIFFIFLGTLIILYFFFLKRVKPERRLTPLMTGLIIYKGMLTNFILVFCTFYQLLIEGGMAINKIYIIYLVAITLAPMLYARLLKRFLEEKMADVIALGIGLGFLCLFWAPTFYLGVLVLTIFTSQLNLRLNNLVYLEANLPKDYRLLAKYRLTNVGSILHQLTMMFIMYIATLVLKKVTIDEILQSYTYKNVDEATYLTMNITKIVLIILFMIGLYLLQKEFKKEKQSKVN